MRRLGLLLLPLLMGISAHAQVRLPETRVLRGALDPQRSEFGDEFYNFPAVFGGRAAPGSTFLDGWIEFTFGQEADGYVGFQMRFDAVGTPDGIAFPGGQTYELLDNRAYHNPDLVSRGRLNLDTGEIDKFELHALFRNSVIARVTRNVRIPLGFINDYPPTSLPVDLPFEDDPAVYTRAAFRFDTERRIVGFEFHGATIAPVTVFPRLSIFPLYSFAEEETFYFANPDGCLPGTPPDRCLAETTHPDGIPLPANAFFHPHFDLASEHLQESEPVRERLPCLPAVTWLVDGAVTIGSEIFIIGGAESEGTLKSLFRLDADTGEWNRAADLPQPVRLAQIAGIGARVYILGGLGSGSTPSPRVQIYDTSSDQWLEGEPAPQGRYGGTSAVIGSRVYLLGGWEAGASPVESVATQVLVYDAPADTWSQAPDLPASVAGAAAVAFEGRVFLFGGVDPAGNTSDGVWILDPVAGRWESGPTLPQAVYRAAAAAISGRIFVAGGRIWNGIETEPGLQILDVAGWEWRESFELPIPVSSPSVVSVNGQLLLLGGSVLDTLGRESRTVAVQSYDPSAGWSTCTSHPLFRSQSILSAAAGKVAPRHLSPGARTVLLGHNLARNTVAAPMVRRDGRFITSDLPLELGGTQLWVAGRPAPLLSVDPNILEFAVPYDILSDCTEPCLIPVRVERTDLGTSAESLATAQSAAPAVYVLHNREFQYEGYLDGATAVARNSDGFINHPSRPAAPEEVIKVTCTGLGAVSPDLEDGQRTPATTAFGPQTEVQVYIDEVPAELLSAVLLPLDVGIFELEVRVPRATRLGNNIPIQVSVGSVISNRASISVR